jgi:outer membrane biosynthesis protein TonB
MHILDLHESIATQMDQEPAWADASAQQRINEHRRRLQAIRAGQMEAPPVPSGWAEAGMERIKTESKRPRPAADRRSFVTDSRNSCQNKKRPSPKPHPVPRRSPKPKPKPKPKPETAVKQNWRTCRTCGEPIKTKWTGRPPKYCGNACKQKAYRERRKVKEATQ